ncbi:MAG TPA: tyrosine--tRNA ligase [Thermomicrobiales bacterium]
MVDVTNRTVHDGIDTTRNVYDVLEERGFIAQSSDGPGLREALAEPAGRPVTAYVGFDPTATSLHVGHLLSIMTLAHLQRHGHRPIALIGGGTGMIGDPTDKASTRPILTLEQIEQNIAGMRPQFARYLDFDGGRFGNNPPALLLNNADWLLGLKYVAFLRDIGKLFSVNQMLSHSTYRDRLESGSLNFIEINYVLLQSYDFLHQFREFGCTLQFGGGDQWFNVLAGSDLIRRVEGAQAFAAVTPLLTTSDGRKMGKTTGGSTWLDASLTSPYQFYQFFMNVEDEKVEQLLKLYTFLSLEEIARLASLEGAEIRAAKEALAFEATRLSHGVEAAEQARAASHALFAGGGDIGEGVPTTAVSGAEIAAGFALVDLLVLAGLAKSKGEARRLIGQGGASVNGTIATDVDGRVGSADLRDDAILLRAGKKRYARVIIGG